MSARASSIGAMSVGSGGGKAIRSFRCEKSLFYFWMRQAFFKAGEPLSPSTHRRAGEEQRCPFPRLLDEAGNGGVKVAQVAHDCKQKMVGGLFAPPAPAAPPSGFNESQHILSVVMEGDYLVPG